MPSEEWPGTYELELLAAEIRLNDPRTKPVYTQTRDLHGNVTVDARVELRGNGHALAHAPTSPALVDAIVRAGRSTRG